MKKILFTATVQSHICLFHLHVMKMLKEKYGCEIHVAARDNLMEKKGLQLDYYDKAFSIPFTRSPISKNNIKAYKMLKNLIKENDYDVIHCNTPVGGILSRMAAKSVGKKDLKVIYTAHGFHFFKGAPKKNWVLFYTLEKYFSKFTDVLITINKEDYNIAKQKFKAKKTEYVPGIGVDIPKFRDVSVDIVEKRKELGVPKDAFLVLSVGEMSVRKNQEVVIKAISKTKKDDIYYVICGVGALEDYLKELAKKEGLEDRFILGGHRRDIQEICKMADVFVFPSLQEGLPVALMEAMASGLPVIASDIRGNVDLIEDGKGGFLVNPYDVDRICDKINFIYNDKSMNESFREFNEEKIKNFGKDVVLSKMEEIYKEVLK